MNTLKWHFSRRPFFFTFLFPLFNGAFKVLKWGNLNWIWMSCSEWWSIIWHLKGISPKLSTLLWWSFFLTISKQMLVEYFLWRPIGLWYKQTEWWPQCWNAEMVKMKREIVNSSLRKDAKTNCANDYYTFHTFIFKLLSLRLCNWFYQFCTLKYILIFHLSFIKKNNE